MRDERNKRFGKALLALTLAFVLLLTSVAGAVEVFAEEGLKTIDFAKGIVVEKPEPKAPITEDAKAKDEKASPVIEKDAKEEKAELELGGEIVGVPVGATIPAPTINDVFIGATTISGKNLHRGKVDGKTVRATVHVTLKDKNGVVKDNVSVTPTSGTAWEVKLSEGVEVAEGDTVTAYQELDGNKSPVTDPVESKQSLAGQNKDKLQMPTGEIWIEQTSSNIVNEDEQAEAVQMFNNANTAIAGDIKSVKFSIDTAEHAYYEITYTDGSASGKVEAPNLKIKQVEEYSRGAVLGSITIVDNVIKGQLSGEGPFDGIKVQILLKLSDAVKDSYCDKGKCKADKNSSDPVDAVVDTTTGKFSYTINPNNQLEKIELGNVVGVTVKEPHKFKSCSKTTVTAPIPEKTEVKDPRKLTAKDKEAIDAAIRKAYTVNDESKLPNGTGDWDGVPAVIQIDASGNVKIFSGNDVEVTYDSNYNPVPVKNEDGSYKLNKDAKPTATIPAKDLVLNKAPEKPALKAEGGNVIVTPDKVDTDAGKVEVTYTGKDGKEKKVTATKGEGGTWTTDDTEVTVDSNGVVTLPAKKVKSKTTVSAKVTDAGGIAEGDTVAKTSEPGSVELTASVQTPSVTVDKTSGDVTVTPKDDDPDAKRLFITYTPANGTEKTVEAKKADDGTWSITGESDFVASADGKSFTIKNADAKEKTQVKAVTKGEEDSLVSDTAEAIVPDKTAPKEPTVTVDASNGNAEITPPKDPDTKTVTVKYQDPSGTEKTATATKENNVWTITEGAADGVSIDSSTGKITIAYANMKKADTVSATAKDDSGNVSKSSTDTTLPPVPTVKVTENKDITVTPPTTEAPAVNGMEVTYTPAGASEAKTIKIVKGNDSKWKLDGDPIEGIRVDENSGVVTIKKGTAKDLSDVSAKSKIDENKKGLETATAKVPDTTAPEAPAVKVQEDGSVTITPKKDSDTKTVTVTYKDQDGNAKTATATKGDNGEWTVTGDNGETIDKTTGVITIPTGKSNPGDKVVAKAKDPSNNESGPSDDTTNPAPPTITPDQESGNVTITPPTKGNLDGMDIEYKTPEGTDRKVRVVKGSDNKWKIEGENPDGVTVEEGTGKVTIPKGKAKEKTEVKADSTLGEKKAPAQKTPENQHLVPDKTAPEKPEVKVQEDGSVTITPKAGSDTKTVTVTYKNQDGKDKTATATKGDNGEWTVTGENGETIDKTTGVITIPTGKLNPGDKVVAKAKDSADNESGPSDDTTKPAPPTITPDQESGNVTITPPTKGNLDGMDIEYQTPSGEKRTVRAKKDADNKWQIEGDNPDGVTVAEDTGLVTIPKGKAKEKTEVKADSTLGEKKAPAQKTPENQHLVPDKTAPNPPTVSVDESNGNVTITPPSDEDTTKVTVTYKDKDGNEKTAIATKADGKWSISGDNGETIDPGSGVISIPKGKYKTEEPVKALGKDEAKNKSKENEATPVEITFDKNGGSKDIDSSIRVKGGNFVLPEIFDKQFFPAGKEFAGWQVGNDTKKPGDTIKVDANTVVKALWKEKPQNKEERPMFFYFKPTTKPVLNLKDHSQYMIGYKDGTFRPNNKMSRQEVTVMLSRLLSERPQKGMIYSRDYKDVADNLWSVTAISYMSNLKMVKGYPDGNFRPYANITRAEFAAMVVRFENISAAGSKEFTDLQKDHWAYEVIQKAAQAGWISGYPDGSFRPDQPITRAEVVAITNRMLNRFADEDFVDHNLNKIINFTDIDKNHWAYYPVVEATNGHNYDRKANGKDETWFEVTGSTFVYDK